MNDELLPVINPYQGKGSLEEAFHRGFMKRRRNAPPSSSYGKVYEAGKAARQAWDERAHTPIPAGRTSKGQP